MKGHIQKAKKAMVVLERKKGEAIKEAYKPPTRPSIHRLRFPIRISIIIHGIHYLLQWHDRLVFIHECVASIRVVPNKVGNDASDGVWSVSVK
jgi:hypothetical protein